MPLSTHPFILAELLRRTPCCTALTLIQDSAEPRGAPTEAHTVPSTQYPACMSCPFWPLMWVGGWCWAYSLLSVLFGFAFAFHLPKVY